MGLNKHQIESLRQASSRTWEDMVNAEKNYPAFVSRLQDLLALKNKG